MTKTDRPEYEAKDTEVFLGGPLGMIVLAVETTDSQKVQVHMRRSVFDNLCAQIANAISAADKRAR